MATQNVSVITLVIPEASPSPNEYNGKHWSKYHRLRKHWSMLILVAKTEARVPYRDPWEKVLVRYIREGRKVLDEENLKGGTKMITDSLREQRLIFNDDPEHATFIHEQVQIGKNDYPRTLVEIRKI